MILSGVFCELVRFISNSKCDLVVQNRYITDRNAVNFMRIVYKMITYSHFTGSKVLCYGKTMLKKNSDL